MAAMLKSGAWLITPLLFLPLAAQEAQLLPELKEPPAVDLITPVPPPVIPFGTPGMAEMTTPKNLNITNTGGIEFIQDVGAVYKGPVKILGDNGLEIYADKATADFKAETATLEGNVSTYQGNLIQRGDKAVYYYARKFLDARNLRMSIDPILMEAGKFTVEQHGDKQVFVGTDAGITTDDEEDPNFWIRAKKTRVYPGEKVVFNDLRFYAGDIPVFWLPYLSQPLDKELGYHFIPGARSTWGPFLLNTYGIMLGGKTDPLTGDKNDAWLLSRWHADIRASRGLGLGVDFVDTRDQDNPEEISGLSFYYLNDLDPSTNSTGLPRGFVNEDRYKIELKQRYKPDFGDKADWRIDSNLTLLSDRYFLEDFEPRFYRTNPAPDNTLGIYRRDDASLLSLYTRFQLNDFYRADTRLPEIAYDQARAPIFGLPIQHEGSTTFGIIGEDAADDTGSTIIAPLTHLNINDPNAERLLDQLTGYERRLAEDMLMLPLNDPRRKAIRTQLLDSGYSRFRTYQQFSLPTMLDGFLSLTPQAGIGYTNYSAVDGPIDNLDRTTLYGGIEASVKFSKDLGAYRKKDWGLDGLMHVFQPYTDWSVVSTNDFEPGDPGVDRLTPTTRPRPLDPARFTAVDELQSWNVIRLGARNHLLTKRDGQSYEWLYLDTYIDTFIDDPEGQRDFSNLYNDFRWDPLPWLSTELETQFPIADGGSGFSEYVARIRFQPSDKFEFSLGYRWLNGHPILLDSNHFDLFTYTRLSENWGFGMHHEYEMDDGTLELQQYTLHRDLGNWVAGMGLGVRDNRLKHEYSLVFSLTLKDFPSVSLPLDISAQ